MPISEQAALKVKVETPKPLFRFLPKNDVPSSLTLTFFFKMGFSIQCLKELPFSDYDANVQVTRERSENLKMRFMGGDNQ